MKDINLSVISDKEARASAPASFVSEVHLNTRKFQGKMGIFVAGIITGAVAIAVASEIMNDLNSPYDLERK